VFATRADLRANRRCSSSRRDRDARIGHLARDAIVERECTRGIVQAVLARARSCEQLVGELRRRRRFFDRGDRVRQRHWIIRTERVDERIRARTRDDR
jgi:hypothetical protein